ncbi:23S rRNA (adenine(2030)-N(6))-methyltransferase RlmJ [Tahibacter soli]|uniref:Ribosomal RNA large subunit methyltransferase J n=1 Tax=Tahibacter soli TaxID=2983605 RepID=A0A9X3YJZ3_9GAMM|nr:23S rRNA (adenine(2030)-N(6))-methyltransferase RlmJ [Tahibacter soli]MDC8012173.1 23S rRNA (adenine(2030)-N(6))-methyltransferase RlmJ [Tahibacter soli]
MNYRHAYHAGNFADVLKHSVLVGLIEALKQKATPFCYIDTHAGSGRYDLRGEEALKTGEHADGVLRLLEATRLPAALHVYLNLVRALNAHRPAHDLSVYPGSPLIASLLMRENDRAQLCELQPDECARLRELFRGDARVAVHERDGYAALKAMLPPKEKRGLVLIDPPFEAQDSEFRVIEAALAAARTRWPNGVYAIWYPIKLRQHLQPFYRWLKTSGFTKVLAAELLLHPDNSALRLNGTGMVVVNAPWKFDQQLEELLPVLTQHMAQGRFGQHGVEWIVGE